jgi:hypothetical protein
MTAAHVYKSRDQRRSFVAAATIAGLAVGILAGCGDHPASSADQQGARQPADGTAAGSPGGGQPAGNQTENRACGLLTQDEAARIIGRPVGSGKGPNRDSCTYTATSEFATVGLSIFNDKTSANTVNQYKSMYPDAVPGSGLGDASIVEPGGWLVVAVKGNIACVMLRTGADPSDPAASTKQLKAVCVKVFAANL